MNLVAIDPAARRYAYAVFHDGVLARCGYAGRSDTLESVLDDDREYVWVMEIPTNYTDFAVAHRDLDRLRVTLRRLKTGAVRTGEKVVVYRPSAWKGNVPKRIHHNRSWAVLSEKERMCLPDRPGRVEYQHDVHDAVALGLTHLGRIARGGKRRA